MELIWSQHVPRQTITVHKDDTPHVGVFKEMDIYIYIFTYRIYIIIYAYMNCTFHVSISSDPGFHLQKIQASKEVNIEAG